VPSQNLTFDTKTLVSRDTYGQPERWDWGAKITRPTINFPQVLKIARPIFEALLIGLDYRPWVKPIGIGYWYIPKVPKVIMPIYWRRNMY
jgi:hypothetical protein